VLRLCEVVVVIPTLILMPTKVALLLTALQVVNTAVSYSSSSIRIQ
jgi:hypothetical protein